VQNGTFSDGSTSWSLQVNHNDVVASMDASGGEAAIQIEQVAGTGWHLQLLQWGHTLVQGQTYAFSFRARADAERDFGAAIGRNYGDYGSYSYQACSVGTEMKTFSWTFTMDQASDDQARIVFDFGTSDVNIYIDDVSLQVYSPDPSLAVDAPTQAQSWAPGDTLSLEWSVHLVDAVDLAYSTDNGGSWTSIAEDVDASLGSYEWAVVNEPTNELLLRVADASNAELAAQTALQVILDPGSAVTLRTKIEGEGYLDISPLKASYSIGETVQIRAVPDGANWFVGWTGDVISSENPITVTMDEAKSLRAVFRNQLVKYHDWAYQPRHTENYTQEHPHLTSMVFVRVELEDAPLIMTAEQTQEMLDDSELFYHENSYGREHLEYRLLPETIHLDITKAEARAQFSRGVYMRDLVYAKLEALIDANPDYEIYDYRDSDGLGMQIPAIWGDDNGESYHGILNCEAVHPGTFILIHEMGHYFGLPHSSSWRASTDDPLGPGTHIEYGGLDYFEHSDTALFYKQFLGWVKDDQVLQVAESGTYRIYAHDFVDADGVLGLSIDRGDNTALTVEVMRDKTQWATLSQGALIRCNYGYPTDLMTSTLHMLDMNPETSGTNLYENDDNPLMLGESFTDAVGGITLTVEGEGGSGAGAWVDIKVEFIEHARPTIPYAESAPVIDGTREALWDQALALEIGNGLNEFFPETETDFDAKGYVIYDAENVYLYVEVTDDERLTDSGSESYNDDCIEVFFDGDHSSGESYDEVNDSQIRFRPPNDIFINDNSAISAALKNGIQYQMTDDGTTYVLEAAFPIDVLGVNGIMDGKPMGFDVLVNDDDPGEGSYTGALKRAWHMRRNTTYFNPNSMGDIYFEEAPISAGYALFMMGRTGLNEAEKVADADPDRDGMANLLEFYLAGQNPEQGGCMPVALERDASGHRFAFDLREGVSTDDLHLEWSNDLGAESWNPVDGIEGAQLSLENSQLQLILENTPAPFFLRLRAVE